MPSILADRLSPKSTQVTPLLGRPMIFAVPAGPPTMIDFLTDGAELFATSCVRNFQAALAWYETVLGTAPTFFAHPAEAVWEVATHRWIVVERRPDRAGFGTHTLYVTDLDERLAGIAARGVEPDRIETYDEGVRKMIFIDPDGNELCFGGNPA